MVFEYPWSTLVWYWCYYLHRSRDLMSPVCGIFKHKKIIISNIWLDKNLTTVFKIQKKSDTWHVTWIMWHVTCDMVHMTYDMWNVTHGGGWTLSQNVISLALRTAPATPGLLIIIWVGKFLFIDCSFSIRSGKSISPAKNFH